MSVKLNRLAGETSPYLQQHAGNPVDWYPWSKEALAKAEREDKPILLSIGYSACHWCHVMAHESFEDEETAKVMNALFVNIKVDREERPDLDKIYQLAQMLLTQRTGGWPLTMFLTPEDRIPFFGGTYFPKQPMHGLPAFRDLLARVNSFYREHRSEIGTQNDSMLQALASVFGSAGGEAELDPAVFDMARGQLEQSFDAQYGGFGRAPKFPHATQIEFLLRHWARTRLADRADRRALHMATFTLEKMARGGINDHLGGGFCRYSVDDRWTIPHFEKMLYDNGPLLALYAQAFAATGNRLFADTAEQTAEWILRDMQSPEGGYYSSLDADSEGEEGKYYVWEPDVVRAVVDDEDCPLVVRRFGLDRSANFEGKWHLEVAADIAELAREFQMGEEAVRERLEHAREQLLAARSQRVPPGRDEKVLTSWNALAIKGMAVASRYLKQPRYAESATRALDFIHGTLWRDGRLLATYKDGKAHLQAYLDDYAFLIDAILPLLEVRWRSQDLDFACALADVLLDHYEDAEHGGFWFTADDHESLIQRPKALSDESIPSGNGVAAFALARLGYLTAETRYLQAAERTLRYAAKPISDAPMAHAGLLMAYEEQLHPPQLAVLRGSGTPFTDWQRLILAGYAPRRMNFAIPADAADLPPALAEKTPRDGMVAYICTGLSCAPPVTKNEKLRDALRETTAQL